MRRRTIPYDTIKSTSNFCIYCGTYLKEWEKVVDHFLPWAYMENNSERNLFVSCRECNSIKSDKTFAYLEDAREYILEIKADKGVGIVELPTKNKKNEREYNICYTCGIQFIGLKNDKYCSDDCMKEKCNKYNKIYQKKNLEKFRIYNKKCKIRKFILQILQNILF